MLLVDQVVPSGSEIYCRFGDAALPASSMFYEGTQTAVTCTAPPGEALTKVDVSLSLDGGSTYIDGGDYYYHEPLQLYTIAPSGAPSLQLITALLREGAGRGRADRAPGMRKQDGKGIQISAQAQGSGARRTSLVAFWLSWTQG